MIRLPRFSVIDNSMSDLAVCCGDFVASRTTDWGSAPDPEVCRLLAKPEGREARVAGATRPSVSDPGTALELLFSSALSFGRGSSTLRRRRRVRHRRQLALRTGNIAWSCLAGPSRLRQIAELRLHQQRETSLAGTARRRYTKCRNTVTSTGRSVATARVENVVLLGRARRGPAWAGLDTQGESSLWSSHRSCSRSFQDSCP